MCSHPTLSGVSSYTKDSVSPFSLTMKYLNIVCFCVTKQNINKALLWRQTTEVGLFFISLLSHIFSPPFANFFVTTLHWIAKKRTRRKIMINYVYKCQFHLISKVEEFWNLIVLCCQNNLSNFVFLRSNFDGLNPNFSHLLSFF